MAGSLNHIIGEDGHFTMASTDNLGDAYEALDECFKIIYHLSKGDSSKVSSACRALNLPDPWDGKYEDDMKQPMRLGGEEAL
jgi:hypothetical protein